MHHDNQNQLQGPHGPRGRATTPEHDNTVFGICRNQGLMTCAIHPGQAAQSTQSTLQCWGIQDINWHCRYLAQPDSSQMPPNSTAHRLDSGVALCIHRVLCATY